MRNPYSVLGVDKNADEKAIKSAFRKLAMKYHPDQNPNDKSAQAKFADANQAYEIIGDKEKRAQYDRGEIDEAGKPKFAGFGGFGGGAGSRQHGGSPFGGGGFSGGDDIFSEIFGAAFGGSAQTNRNSRHDAHVNMGGGDFGGFAGANRGGRAASLDLEMKAAVTIEDLMRGKTNVRMPDGKQISVSIPPEAEDGQVIRLKGKGNTAPGRKQGDALVTLKMRRDQRYERSGVDLRSDVPLPLKTAVLGGKIPVETMDGKLSLSVPPQTNSGKVFRLKGKGLPTKSGGHGDLLVSTVIQLSEDDLSGLTQFYKTQS